MPCMLPSSNALSEIKEKCMEKFGLSQAVTSLNCSSFPFPLVFGVFPPATNPQENGGGD